MADKWTALHTFFNEFGITAYDENTVPESAEMPYITYEAQTASLGEALLLSASIWYRSNSWAEISQKADGIGDLIGGGYKVPYDNGRLWITKSAPFATRMSEPSDEQIRRIVLQITAEFQ